MMEASHAPSPSLRHPAPVLILSVSVGLAAAGAILASARVQQHLPARTVCPACGGPTAAVRHAAIPRWVERRVHRRWCPACAWAGLARTGPGLDGDGPSAHRSGFRWSADETPAELGFRWATGEREGATPPDHGSGFRWGGGVRGDDRPAGNAPDAPPVHPSGFRWAGQGRRREAEDPGVAGPSGFRWADGDAAADPSGFHWRDGDRGADRPDPGDPSGFRWKDADRD